MKDVHVRLRLHAELSDFLPRSARNTELERTAGITDTVKHVIESAGVSHTEIGRIMVNGHPRQGSDRISDGDSIEVYPRTPGIPLEHARFVVDGHLGRLAAFLRMLGFNTWYDHPAGDALLASVAAREGRVLLTRDVGLLKRREVEVGYYVRSDRPRDQLREVLRQFDARAHLAPFTRCMDCNGALQPAALADVAHLLPTRIRAMKTEFTRCTDCGKIYWEGSHHARMMAWIATLGPGPAGAERDPNE